MVHSDRVNFHAGGKLKRYPRRPRLPHSTYYSLKKNIYENGERETWRTFLYIYIFLTLYRFHRYAGILLFFFFCWFKNPVPTDAVQNSILDTIFLLQVNWLHANVRFIQQRHWSAWKTPCIDTVCAVKDKEKWKFWLVLIKTYHLKLNVPSEP